MKQIINKTIISAVIFSLTLMAGIYTALAKGKEPIGKVTAIRGEVIALDEHLASRPLSLTSPVYLKDTIKTKNGRIQMMFKDNTLVSLGQNSDLQITQYLWKPGSKDSKMVTRVQEGSFRILGGAITREAPDNFTTESESGTIGIRGSMYAGRVENDSLFVVFQGGKGIYITNPAGMVNITRPGFGSRIKNRTLPPEEPQKITPAEMQALENTLASAPLPQAPSSAGAPPEGTVPQASDQTGVEAKTAEKTTDLKTETNPLEKPVTGPASTLSSVISNTAQDVAQNSVNSAMTPTGTQQTIQFMLLELGFKETAISTGISASGISSYKGNMKNILKPSEPYMSMKFVVNWNNNRILGVEADSSGHVSPGFGFATINPSTGAISNMTILGSGGGPGTGEIMTLTGSETFGSFYGSSAGALGIAMQGNDYNVRDQTISHAWSDIVAAKLESTINTSYTGTSIPWQGYIIGVSENMAAPDVNRRVYRNTNSIGSFNLTLNKDAGTFTGTLMAEDYNNAANDITALSIGGSASDSAFLTDQIMGARITSATIDTGGSVSVGLGLKTYGNYMVTSNESKLSSYTAWGYWEIAYIDPGTSNNYHLHVPGSRWIAGPQGTIDAGFTGIYEGGAKGVKIETTGSMIDLSGGKTVLNIDFSGGSTPVSGNITFDGGVDLQVTNSLGDLTTSGFTATIYGVPTSFVSGSFYGDRIGSSPAAPSVGGNFSATMPGGTQYHGIFGGDLK